MGGTFNATATQAHDDLESQRSKELNKSILRHGDGSSSEETNPTVHAQTINPPVTQPPAISTPVSGESQQQNPQVVDLDAARQAVDSAVAGQPFDPANHPIESLGSQPLSSNNSASQQRINIDDNGKITKTGIGDQNNNDSQLPTLL